MRSLALVPYALLSAACVALPENADAPAAAPRTRAPALVAKSVPAQTNAAAEDAAPGRSVSREEAGRLAPHELALWNDPAFQARFTESYLAESDIEPRVPVEEREAMQAVLDALAADDLTQAASLLQGLRTETSSAVIDYTLANLHFQREELGLAADAYRSAVQKFPRFRRAWNNLGLAHVRQNEFEPAARAFTRVIELGGGNALTYGLLGFAHANLRRDLAAESAYRVAALLEPDEIEWQMGLALSFFKQERFADAAALCGNLIEGQPDRADLWLLQGKAYVGLGQPLRAVENYELVDRLGQSTAESLALLGDIYVNEELFDLAVGAYGRALAKDANLDLQRLIRAAKVMTARGAHVETLTLLASMEAARGELPSMERKELLRLRARVALAQDAGEEEARVLEEIVALDPLDGEALILLGQHAGRADDPEQAIFYFERAASMQAFEADAKLRHAQLLVKQGKYAEALPLLRRAQTLSPRANIQEYLERVERAAQNR